MLIPDFTKYSLALFKDEKLIHASDGGGLRPLWDALEKHKDKTGLLLHDKLMGLAAARLIVRSGIIAEIYTMIASRPAKEFLEESGIRLTAFDVVASILTKDKSSVCPGEVIAIDTTDPDTFLQKIRVMMDNRMTKVSQ
ncbi:MAG: hypothetical protein FD159_774 [Syntrophaceae bacterium]|nr:MAG: hypothetical protein FD159_774 [Syntrophaceae bacterium]